MGDNMSDSQDSHDEWVRCWNCDGPVRRHWDECPALGCGVELPPETRASEATRSLDSRGSPKKKPLRDWSEQAEERTRKKDRSSSDANGYVDEAYSSPGKDKRHARDGKLLLAPAHSDSDISYGSAADETLESPTLLNIPRIQKGLLPKGSDPDVKAYNGDGRQHSQARCMALVCRPSLCSTLLPSSD